MSETNEALVLAIKENQVETETGLVLQKAIQENVNGLLDKIISYAESKI